MNKYSIKRIDCNSGIVEMITHEGCKMECTEVLPYDSCMNYVKTNQVNLRVYKVGKYAIRKNATRHLYGCIYAEDDELAKQFFHDRYDLDVQTALIPYRLELCTGDWKVIDAIEKE